MKQPPSLNPSPDVGGGIERDLVLALRDKYREIKRLRDVDAAGHAGDPRAEMAALAARFPGTLRELDRLPMAQIETRIAALDRVLDRGESVPDWARRLIAFHGWLRAALRMRDIARGATSAGAALARVRKQYRAAPDEPGPARIDAALLAAILRPPHGRLTAWALAQVAADCGVSAADLERALFGQ